jgi:hypothetical protein
MIEIPMEDCWERQFREGIQLEPHRAGGQLEVRRDVDERGEGGAVERDGVVLSETSEVNAMAMKRRHHGQTREATLGPLGLQDHGRSLLARKGETCGCPHG